MSEPTQYTCYDCTGRGGELIVFSIEEGGSAYEHDPSHCPICGQSHTVQTRAEYTEKFGDNNGTA